MTETDKALAREISRNQDLVIENLRLLDERDQLVERIDYLETELDALRRRMSESAHVSR